LTGDLVAREVSHCLHLAHGSSSLGRSCYSPRGDAGSRGATGAERSELALDAAVAPWQSGVDADPAPVALTLDHSQEALIASVRCTGHSIRSEMLDGGDDDRGAPAV
jgi:hypothetical protein